MNGQMKEAWSEYEITAQYKSPTFDSGSYYDPSEQLTTDIRMEAAEIFERGQLEMFEANYDDALVSLNQSLALYQRVEDKKRILEVQLSIGIIKSWKGELNESLAILEPLLIATEEHRLYRLIITNCLYIGNIYSQKSDYPKSDAYFKRALDMARKIGDLFREEMALGYLGDNSQLKGKYKQAISFYRQSGHITRKTGAKRNEGVNLGNIGLVYKQMGLYDKAISQYEQALEIARMIKNKQSESIILGNIGDTLIYLKRWDKAEQYLIQAISICKEIDFHHALGSFSYSLAWVYSQQGKLEQAIQLINENEPLVIDYPSTHGLCLCIEAKIRHQIGQSKEATAALMKAKKIASDLQLEESELQEEINEATAFISSP